MNLPVLPSNRGISRTDIEWPADLRVRQVPGGAA